MISKWIYTTLLPIYIPNPSAKVCLAIWCGINCKLSNSLLEVLKGIRITIRSYGNPKVVVKRGHV